MDIKDLHTFLLLCETSHFGLTAKSLHMTPSTLSRQIQRLEDEIGQTLFIRDNRSVNITDEGLKLKKFATQVIADYTRLQQDLDKDHKQLTGELKLFCSVTAAYSHLPEVLDLFRIRYPKVEIKLTTGDAADAVEKVQSDEVHLAIAGRPKLLPSSIDFLKLGEIEMALFIPRLQTPFSDKLHQRQPDWDQIPFILPEHGPSRQRIDAWFKAQKISSPQIYATVSGHEAIAPMIALGCGVAFLPKVVVDNTPEKIKERIIEWSSNLIESFDIGICVQKKRLSERAIYAFWEIKHQG